MNCKLQEIPNRAFGKVSINLIVDLPVSHHGNKHILVMVDHLTSWPIATAIPDKEVITVANAIHKDLILQHGAPEINEQDLEWAKFCNCHTVTLIEVFLNEVCHSSSMAHQ